MVRLNLIEESPNRLTFKMGALAMIGQMSLLTIMSILVVVALMLFTIRWIGLPLSFLLIAVPGLSCAVCGVFGCCNARSFTFTFDRACGEFIAQAGDATLRLQMTHIVLVYIERECDSGGMFTGGSAPSYSVTLMLRDGYRFHLEGGVPVTGHDRGPPELHSHADKIREFVRLPQRSIPLLDLRREAVPEKVNDAQAEARFARWMTCKGISPKMEPPLYEYNWLEPPDGVMLPPPAMRPAGGYGHIEVVQVRQQPMYNQGGTPTVVGRPQTNQNVVMGQPVQQQASRFMQLAVPDGTQGQIITVQAPTGEQVQITVPIESTPGEIITLQY